MIPVRLHDSDTDVCSANAVVAITAILLSVLFKRRNKLADEGKAVYNDSPEFRYTI